MKIAVPKNLETAIENILKNQFNMNFQQSHKLAECVLRLSDYYTQNPGLPTPWQENWCQIAYLVYFLPLNTVRNLSVQQRLEQVGFWKQQINQVIDFGSGLGAATLGLPLRTDFLHIESSPSAQKLHQMILKETAGTEKHQWIHNSAKADKNALGIFSYSFAEISQLPSWTANCQSLVVIEPATRDQGRRLLELRQQLLSEGWHLWAPCTHSQKCPLLIQNKTDWCHDRVHFEAPEWFKQMEHQLPMKNRTLTMSYLAVSKIAPPPFAEGTARITGDHLTEKGKSRQLICRNETREFLAWMHKETTPQELERGDLVMFPSEFVAKSNEIRVKSDLKHWRSDA